MKIAFFDTVCPKPYDEEALENEPMGGTEATVVRVARSLRSRGHEVVVFQHNRETQTATYTSFDDLPVFDPDALVSIRSGVGIAYAEKMLPNAKRAMWLHDLPGDAVVDDLELCRVTDSPVVCVSKWHAGVVSDHGLKHLPITKGLVIETIYNPVMVPVFGETHTDASKLVFFSSPHKGLKETIENFLQLKATLPHFKLYVANPGYYKLQTDIENYHNVTNLGELTHKEVMRHVAESFCVYHANFVFPETFGLVHAEANALGVPVLTHPHGANLEILGGAKSPQLAQARDMGLFNARVSEWLEKGRPMVGPDPRFSITAVTDEWERLLGAGQQTRIQ